MFVALGVIIVTVAFGLVTYLLKKQGDGKKKRPVALDSQKKIPFKLIDKKVLISTKIRAGISSHLVLGYVTYTGMCRPTGS